jgi:hypothetical protein
VLSVRSRTQSTGRDEIFPKKITLHSADEPASGGSGDGSGGPPSLASRVLGWLCGSAARAGGDSVELFGPLVDRMEELILSDTRTRNALVEQSRQRIDTASANRKHAASKLIGQAWLHKTSSSRQMRMSDMSVRGRKTSEEEATQEAPSAAAVQAASAVSSQEADALDGRL